MRSLMTLGENSTPYIRPLEPIMSLMWLAVVPLAMPR
jgi:hypothetical protein